MKKDNDFADWLSFVLAVLVTLLGFARCSQIGDESEAVTCTNLENMRVSAPEEVYEEDAKIRRDVSTEETIAEISGASMAAPEVEVISIYDLMDETSLRTEVQMMIEDVCAARDVDVRVVLGIIEVENSSFDERAVGDNGEAFGLMQVRPDSHWDRMLRLGVTDLLDGVQNVLVGIDYLDELLDRYGGDYYKAVTAYNKGHWPGYVTPYAYKVMAIAGKEVQ